MADLNKLNRISKGKSNWIDNAEKRQKNKDWLKNSKKIALKVLQTLRDKKMSQKNLAEIINVSPQQINKIVKGKENMTLETITKLENALDIRLLYFENKHITAKKEYALKKYFAFNPIYFEKNKNKHLTKQKSFDIYMDYNLNLNILSGEKIIIYGES